jgi:hypothetical protein
MKRAVSHDFSNLRARKYPFFDVVLVDPRKFMLQVEKPTAILIHSLKVLFLLNQD